MSEESSLPPDELSREMALPYRLHLDVVEIGDALNADGSLDLFFLAYLLRFQRFGFFTFGPVTIDVRVIEDLIERTVPRRGGRQREYTDDYVRFSRVLMDEVRRSGRKRVDELHYLLAFMRVGEGIPSRVFGELGVTAEQVESWVAANADGGQPLEKLYSPEEAAEYLGVHVQTVRAWIRSGRLPASRLAGQRALRIKASDLGKVLEPVQPGELD